MNRTILIGNLCRDPELRATQSGIPVCRFTIAVNRRFANAQGVREADFIQIITWRQLAENCGRYLSKGRKVAVEGSIQTRSYDGQDGAKRYVTEIVADRGDFLSPSQGGSGAPLPDAPPDAYQASAPGPDGFTEVQDDELPF